MQHSSPPPPPTSPSQCYSLYYSCLLISNKTLVTVYFSFLYLSTSSLTSFMGAKQPFTLFWRERKHGMANLHTNPCCPRRREPHFNREFNLCFTNLAVQFLLQTMLGYSPVIKINCDITLWMIASAWKSPSLSNSERYDHTRSSRYNRQPFRHIFRGLE